MILYCATGNPGKLREFAASRGADLHVHACPCYNDLPPCEENGRTFEANASLKAEYYSTRMPGELVFADDSGLEVDSLNGEPGVHSARYSGPGATDAFNNAKLLAVLSDIPVEWRTARYVCVIALARDGKTLALFRDTAEGVIISTPRGEGGFGYDPYFLSPELGRTFAELSTDEKWDHSHRGKAFRKMLAALSEHVLPRHAPSGQNQ